MVPTIHKPGRGLAGLLAYVTHDTDNRETADRVEWTAAVNLPVDDVATCGRIMAATVRDADHLKAAAGISTRGRKLRKPYEHITLSWAPTEPRPTRAQMRDAADEALDARGYRGCHAFLACHTDRDHPHVHIVVCRIDPSTGQARKPTHARKLQRWAENYEEKTHGPALVIPNRRARRLVRQHNGREIRAAVRENREPENLKKLPPMKPRPVRDPLGRVTAPRNDEERAAFNELLEAHRQDGTPRAQARRDRVALSRTQAQARLEDKQRRVSRTLRTAAEPPAQAPARVNPRPVDVLPPRHFVVVPNSSRAPDPPAPVRQPPARPDVLSPRHFVVVPDSSRAPDPPAPVRAAPARTPTVAIRDNTPPPPPRRIEPPRPTSPAVVRGKGRPVGGARPSKPSPTRERP